MEQFLSNRVKQILPSQLITLQDKGRSLKAAGQDVLVFSGGEPDFATPKAICDRAADAMYSGDTHYVNSSGTPELRQAIAKKLKVENNIDVNWENQIIVTPGGKNALYMILAAILNPGDEVLLLEPAWVTYRQLIIWNGGVPVSVALDFADNYAITREKLEAAISPRTKAIIINTPNNPTGRVLNAEEANVLADFIAEHQILAISDEIYEKIIYDGRQHISLGAIEKIKDYVITLNGMSKGYAMTGWRLGYIAAHPTLIKNIQKVVQNTITCAPSFLQTGAVAAFDCGEEVEAMRQSYEKRRDFMVKALNELPGVTCPNPEGAFYLLPKFEVDDMDSWQLADYILEKALVVLAPGDAFGAGGAKCLRISYATAMADLERAAERLYKLFK